MGTPNMENYRYWVHTRTGYAYGTHNLHTEPYLFLHSCLVVVGAAKTAVEKKTKIILLFYCMLILSLAFDENSRGVHKKSKTLKQHDDRSVVIHLKKLYFDVLYQLTRTFIFFKFVVLRTGTAVPVPMQYSLSFWVKLTVSAQ